MAARLNCPTCQRQIVWSDEYPYRPFCSDRCRLIDLGAWLSEQRAIADTDSELSNETGDSDQTHQN
jgi:endogenous inhibitor of DNA gyrase (YacG/DUF329 family)